MPVAASQDPDIAVLLDRSQRTIDSLEALQVDVGEIREHVARLDAVTDSLTDAKRSRDQNATQRILLLIQILWQAVLTVAVARRGG